MLNCYFKSRMDMLRRTQVILFFLIATLRMLVAQAAAGRITEARYIPVNGIDQWVTICGDSSKPVILFLHGGPGSPLSLYAVCPGKDCRPADAHH